MGFTKRRAEIVAYLTEAFWHLTQEGGLGDADEDVLKLILHRLRDTLRDGDCPSCVEIQLAKDLDQAIEK